MKVTFLAHSGFLVELETVCLLFDWWKGALPPLPDKPLVCFASHRHPDHFDPRIFALDDGTRPVRFVLSRDIRLTEKNRSRWGLRPETAEKCLSVPAEAVVRPGWGVKVETLRSTDEGAAFLVSCEERVIYHAGDLNWWHWNGEDKAWNRSMEANFKRYLEPLRSRRLDLAMVPLDPRLEDAADWGARYLLELAQIRTMLPMHQWEKWETAVSFLERFPQWAGTVLPVERPGQQWEL